MDPVDEKIYWTDINAGTIVRANLDGSNVETWMSGLAGPTGLAITNAHIYWAELTADNAYGTISRATRSGAGLELLVVQIDSPGSIAVDALASTVLWIDQGIIDGSSSIQRSPLSAFPIDGSLAEVLLPNANAKDIALNAAQTALYYTENSTPTSLRLRSLSSTTDVSIHDGASIYNSATVDAFDTLFWGEGVIEPSARIVRQPAGASASVLLDGSVAHPQDLAAGTDGNLYGIDGDVTGPSIFRISAE